MCPTNDGFEQLEIYFENFDYLNKLPEKNNKSSRNYCNDFNIILRNGDRKNVNAIEFFDNLFVFQDVF